MGLTGMSIGAADRSFRKRDSLAFVRVPIGVRRPFSACRAHGLAPLILAARADTAGVESIPAIPAVTTPEMFGTRRPCAFRTADERSTGIGIRRASLRRLGSADLPRANGRPT